MLSHFSAKASSSFSLPSLSHLSRSAASSFRHCHGHRIPKFPFCLSLPLKFPALPLLACRASSGSVSMDSPSPSPDVPAAAAASVESVARDLQNQSLRSGDDDQRNYSFGNGAKRARLRLEDLNWDHSFVRELPGDPISDTTPREVTLFLFGYCLTFDLIFCLAAEKVAERDKAYTFLAEMFGEFFFLLETI